MERPAAGTDGGDVKAVPSEEEQQHACMAEVVGAEKQPDPTSGSSAPSTAEQHQLEVDDPMRWSAARKWTVTLGACYFSSLISVAASAYVRARVKSSVTCCADCPFQSLGIDAMVRDLAEPRLLLVAGISAYVVAGQVHWHSC
jgi:hypothetical protein